MEEAVRLELGEDPNEAPARLRAWGDGDAWAAFAAATLLRKTAEVPASPPPAAWFDPTTSGWGPDGVLAAATALAAVPDDWAADLVAGIHADIVGRPRVWADLAVAATVLRVLEPPDQVLLGAVQDCRAWQPAASELGAARATVMRLRRQSWIASWAHAAKAWLAPLGDALVALQGDAVPMAAADAAPDALARVRLAELEDGELSVAVLPDGVVLEWVGDARPTDAALGDTPLAATHPGLADCAWSLEAPPAAGTPLRLTFAGGERELSWP
jgi:hypothetical protein